jgi:hypothetical protein
VAQRARSLVRKHPRAPAGEAFCAILTACRRTCGPRPAAAASGGVATAAIGQPLRLVRTPFIRRMSQAALRRHCREMRSGQEGPRSVSPALRAFGRHVVLGHRPHRRERSAFGTIIIVDRHRPLRSRTSAGKTKAVARRLRSFGLPGYLSGDMGMSIPPLTCLMGPAALGMTSKSKISVGSHNVAQALGMSTTPEICP